ncbi:HIT family protein [Parasedimentitalea maritima]|uniref:HIT family protein n=1 Tax=Parasedimentitalea maritima TaxID=2578117 RepID=A0ABY2UQI7_9RHOB|nr:HIT family protein [Zongyanglinia marina]TLP58310.1 HIT family protein [Zongyanglinia marina]
MNYDTDNIFAKILRGEIPATRVYEDSETLVFMDIMPRADGHVLVIPKTPCRNVLDATPDQLAAVMKTVQKMSRALMSSFDADGITLQQFNEAAGGQEVFHLHFHLLPRQAGDRLGAPGKMGDQDVIQKNAEKIRNTLLKL